MEAHKFPWPKLHRGKYNSGLPQQQLEQIFASKTLWMPEGTTHLLSDAGSRVPRPCFPQSNYR